VIAYNQPDSFTQTLSRTDGLYFTVTVFATVGFGDITPRSELARIITTTQMLFGLVIFGLIVRTLLGAVQVATRRRESGRH
jgi:voltage-gated potassium channel